MAAHVSRIEMLVNSSPRGCEEIDSLAYRLEEFYNTTTDYTAFNEPPDQKTWLRPVALEIREKFRREAVRIRVLEVGAGCGSNFRGSDCLDQPMYHYTAQDITNTNSEQLKKAADDVRIGPVRSLSGQFDVIFSLFVFEHVAAPNQFLSDVNRLLAPGGTHIVVCPRYDFPGYVCPSMRHLSGMKLFKVEAKRHITNALRHFSDGEAAFWINTDPALFHKKWRRDADAVHIVCQNELIRWHSRQGYRVRKLSPETEGIVDILYKRLATVHLAFDKRT